MESVISRDDAIENVISQMRATGTDETCMRERLLNLEGADVVSRDCFTKILLENDVMSKQLAEIGKRPGDKMDDVLSAVGVKRLKTTLKRCRNELCLKCGKYQEAHLGVCDDCIWKDRWNEVSDE